MSAKMDEAMRMYPQSFNLPPSSGEPGAGPGYPGYTELLNKVLSGIQGVGDSQRQAIKLTYDRQMAGLGGEKQDLMTRGLNNSTIGASVIGQHERDYTRDYNMANTALANQLAQLGAGYTAQLGMSGLQQQGAYQQQQQGYAQQRQMMLLQHQLSQQPVASNAAQGAGNFGGGPSQMSSPFGGPAGIMGQEIPNSFWGQYSPQVLQGQIARSAPSNYNFNGPSHGGYGAFGGAEEAG